MVLVQEGIDGFETFTDSGVLACLFFSSSSSYQADTYWGDAHLPRYLSAYLSKR